MVYPLAAHTVDCTCHESQKVEAVQRLSSRNHPKRSLTRQGRYHWMIWMIALMHAIKGQ